MKILFNSTFKCNFRAPGSQVEGPILFTVGQTSLGKILVGRSQRGICAIFFGGSIKALRDQLAAEFPNIELRADQSSLKREYGRIVGFIEKGPSAGVISLDVGGSAFQQKVWQALCDIPRGETRSYREVARDLGIPTAVRAVAGACAANVLAVAIPCHRVVRSDGSSSDYRWGVERKRALLARECAR